jgi:2-polyprenyl-3-methyl-5-hydroxy-6-metoxy-1,4-benzoquinol methylase
MRLYLQVQSLTGGRAPERSPSNRKFIILTEQWEPNKLNSTTKTVVSQRGCPVCGGNECEVLHEQHFVLPEGHPLANGYAVVVCVKCGFVYANTLVSQTDFNLFYARFSKYEDAKTTTGSGQSLGDALRLRETAACIAKFAPNRDIRILDIGCANGGMLKELSDMGYRNLAGIDPSSVCVKATHGIANVRAFVGSLSEIPKDVGMVDCVILSHVIEHVQDLHPAMKAVADILSDGGFVYVEVPDASRYHEFYYSPFHYFDIEHINHFSPQSLDNLFVAMGFEGSSYGLKTVHVTENVVYPACFGFGKRGTGASRRIKRDDALIEAMRKYILMSGHDLDLVLISTLARSGKPLIVWGVGSSTTRLLANPEFKAAKIEAFAENNQKYWRTELSGRPVISPAEISQYKDATIVITSKLYGAQIVRQLVDELKLQNEIVLLYK